ncbi:nucleotidyltransferase family protein [Methanogenium sp. MK-MG]|uniref:nucleotidyltransferase domain-containing protein n=1 Tax=Methanogenium sp. MK-MG TaxID=2599926 RepID=UPI0013EA8B4A|nr:nucleotidyltransferase family protein [Methanogenium sp. MK-MG]KAF1078140.1 hypothetical protein MKMG_00946 [Methanogenium sp. MK-MG]
MSSDNIVTQARELHESCRLAGSVENELLTLPDPMITWLVMVLRQESSPAPDASAEEWERLLQYLRSHWISPALYWHIRQLPDECRPPDQVMNTLHHLWLHAEIQTIRAGRQIKQVVEALEAAGIPVLLLKGPALARTVYPSPAMRQGSDIDLLIRYEDMKRCEGIMAALGYACPAKTAEQSPHSAHHQNFYPAAEGGPFVIEMHWRLDCGFGLAPKNLVADIFCRSIRVTSDDVTFSTLSVEDHLLYQSFHMACQHCSATRLSWICDIALLSRQVPDVVGWERLLPLSVERNCRLSLESAVSMAEFWTGLSLPPEVQDTALWPKPSLTEERAWALAMRRSGSIPASVRLSLRGIPDTRGKMKYLYRFVFPHADTMHTYSHGNGRLRLPLAYVRRWMLVFQYI